MKHYITLMGQNFLDAYYAFHGAVSGNGERQRYLTCVELVQNSLPMAVARPFVDKYFTDDSIQEVKKCMRYSMCACEALNTTFISGAYLIQRDTVFLPKWWPPKVI